MMQLSWIDEIRARYTGGEASMFILHGNVHDRIICKDEEGKEKKSYGLSEYLRKVFKGTKESVITFNAATGVEASGLARKFFETFDEPPTTLQCLSAIGDFISVREKVAVILEYAETLAPRGEVTMQMEADRATIIMLHRWSQLTPLIDKDNIIILVSETLSELSQKLVSNPRVAIIEIPMPDHDARREAVEMACTGLEASRAARYAEITSGLKSTQITAIVKSAESRKSVGLASDTEVEDLIRTRKREIIKNECFGLMEIVEPSLGFDSVGGIEEIKKILLSVASNMRDAKYYRVPMGILIAGAQGTGKSFLVKAFAKECGATMAIIRNFRGQYVGVTEANQERIIKVAKAIENLILVFDEADRILGNEEDGSGDPTSSRAKARWKEFMSDTSNRGKILFVLMSNRPDLIDVDLKRAGRIDVKIPLFYPQTVEEVEEVLTAIARTSEDAGRVICFTEEKSRNAYHKQVFPRMINFSNADIAEIHRQASILSEIVDVCYAGNTSIKTPLITVNHYIAALDDYFPTRDVYKIELMELLAVFEASSRKLLPEKYRDISAEDLTRNLERLQQIVGNKR
jgi:transitional endoplasmic reticulum ATPase